MAQDTKRSISYPSRIDMAQWGIDMRRDNELIRELMLELEDDPDPVVTYFIHQDSTDDELRRYYHLRLLADAGLLEESGSHGGAWRITNQGHDFIGMTRDQGFWADMKARAGRVTSQYTLRLLFEVGENLLRERLRELGVPVDG